MRSIQDIQAAVDSGQTISMEEQKALANSGDLKRSLKSKVAPNGAPDSSSSSDDDDSDADSSSPVGASGSVQAQPAPQQPAAEQPPSQQPAPLAGIQKVATAPGGAIPPINPKSDSLSKQFGLDPAVKQGFADLNNNIDYQEKLNDSQKSDLRDKQEQIYDKLAGLQDLYKQQMTDAKTDADRKEAVTGWAQAAETLGNALTKFGAAKAGMENKVDLSNVQLSKTDWNANYDRILKSLENQQRTALSEAEVSGKPLEEQGKSVQEQIQNLDNRGQRLRELQAGVQEKQLGEQQQSTEAARTRAGQENIANISSATKMDIAGSREDMQKQIQGMKMDLAGSKMNAKNQKDFEVAKGQAIDALGQKNDKGFETAVQRMRAAGASQQDIDAINAARNQPWYKGIIGPSARKAATTAIQGTELPGSSPAGNNQAAVPAGKVKVKNPSGQVGLIPQEQLQSALAAGYTQVQ